MDLWLCLAWNLGGRSEGRQCVDFIEKKSLE